MTHYKIYSHINRMERGWEEQKTKKQQKNTTVESGELGCREREGEMDGEEKGRGEREVGRKRERWRERERGGERDTRTERERETERHRER